MENTSYALYIAVGTLIAIGILSLILFRWRQIGGFEKSKDETIAIKNKADFNAEYEAYNKKLMYGSDVLSCLNKAQNNNQKYVYNNYYGTDKASIGKDDRAEFFMDVEIFLKSDLYDEVRAYYRNTNGKYERVVALKNSDPDVIKNYNDKVFSNSVANHFKSPVVYYYYFEKGIVKQATDDYIDVMWDSTSKEQTLLNILSNEGKIKTKIVSGTYNLLSSEDTSTVTNKNNSAKLSALITTAGLKNQELMNSVQPSIFNKNDWWYCTWKNCASDFKSRKFKCSEVVYNSTTGYIEKIKFDEI